MAMLALPTGVSTELAVTLPYLAMTATRALLMPVILQQDAPTLRLYVMIITPAPGMCV